MSFIFKQFETLSFDDVKRIRRERAEMIIDDNSLDD
jgi:hypothetical protein